MKPGLLKVSFKKTDIRVYSSNAVFAKVAQHSIRKIAQNVFRHLHNLDLGRNVCLISICIFLFFSLPPEPPNRCSLRNH